MRSEALLATAGSSVVARHPAEKSTSASGVAGRNVAVSVAHAMVFLSIE